MRLELAGLIALLSCVCLIGKGCSDDDGGNNVNNNNIPADDTIYQAQDESHTDFIPEGETVQFENVVVTAVDNYGQYTDDVFVMEPGGGPFSGIKLFNCQVSGGTLADLSLGSIVHVSGVIEEFALPSDTSGRTMTEITNGTIELVGQANPLDPELVASAQTLMVDPTAEQYEGVLVAVENVRRTGTNSFGDVNFTGGLVVGNDLMDADAATTDGSCYSLVVGVIDYFFDYKLHPRIADDLVLASDQNACEQVSDEVCDDTIDNDGDGWTDCEDFDCTGDPACRETICDDGIDNNGNGWTDCEDFDCQSSGDCRENTPALCSDNIDNDGDGDTDCVDWSCKHNPDVLAAGTCSEESGNAQCSDTNDNDGDSFVDCDDWSCEFDPSVTVCATALENTAAVCNDNIDNDGDNYTDCSDFSCQYAGVCPNVESTDAECGDGIDNDGDQHTDCDDWSCQRSIVVTICDGNVFTCSDGLDNEGNGHADCNDFQCRYCQGSSPRSSPVCPPCP